MDASGPADEYAARINRALDFIERNLARGPSLDEIARAAGFSSFHFHRLFSARMGETVGQLTSRLRLERAAATLLDRPEQSITEIALDGGFSSSAAFARAFRAHFGTTASAWRRDAGGRRSNARQPAATPPALSMPRVRVERWPALQVAYVRHIGPYAGDPELFAALIARLMRWAKPRGLVTPESRLLGLYHDPPGVTSDDRLRLSVGLTVPEACERSDGEVERLELGAGDWAVAPFELDPAQYADAWSLVYAHWLPASGYQPAHRPALEHYRDSETPERPGALRVDICLPVEPLVLRPARRSAR